MRPILDRRNQLEAKYKKQVRDNFFITKEEYTKIILEAWERDWPEK